MGTPLIVSCCAPFTLLAGLILMIFAGLMYHEEWTFEVIALKQEWELKEKANCCRNAGIFYLILSVLLWIWVIITNTNLNKTRRLWYRFQRLFSSRSVDEDESDDSSFQRENVSILRHTDEKTFSSSSLDKKVS